eukprot:2163784-Pyramimonas_sp.AAC.1
MEWPKFEKWMAPVAFAATKKELTAMFKQQLREITYTAECSYRKLDKACESVKGDGDVRALKYIEHKADHIARFSTLDSEVNGIKSWR